MLSFQVVSVFVASFVAGALLNQISQLVDSPGGVLSVLGTGAPQTASFFISYILINCLVIAPLGALNPVGLIIYAVRRGLAATDRARRRLWESQAVDFASSAPIHSFTIFLAFLNRRVIMFGGGSPKPEPVAPLTLSFAARKLFASFKKAAWISSTTLLVLLVPLIIEMDREQQMLDMEKEQLSVLTGPAGAKA
ncbi:Mitochondrial import receptor subunit TOM22 2 [Tetrabaena socialis]|uniref:Mitochondrial import receptor subunit TOM22 2 n=1 Tax=Tetrabaena socialis TaxID=47790 RepID=A0A2J8AK27_9CHLO|nr:Mitochondrial import receptor subunit TOM22 2 [Tetrabaena socialis]|eukprot:PNH12876.1 Mitochondrial import receptor subunit TOM22 2 [Tetrabaena socialis]